MLRIGQIDYANCVPIFSAFRQAHGERYSFVRGVPSTLNALLHGGDIDLCPSSSFEYARHGDDYLLLPDLSISAIGPVRSVMLFSTRPLGDLDGATVGLTGESATSVVLLKILLGRYHRLSNRFVTVNGHDLATLSSLPAVLLIGDAALRAVREAKAPFVYDLGELWHGATGFPFVFALWMVRREAVSRDAGAVLRCAEELLAAKATAKMSYRSLAERAAPGTGLTADELAEYWGCISYDLSPSHLAGVQRFFSDARDIGAIERVPELCFVSGALDRGCSHAERHRK